MGTRRRLVPDDGDCREGLISRCLHRFWLDAPYVCIGVFDLGIEKMDLPYNVVIQSTGDFYI